MIDNPQQQFDEKYISASEICAVVGVSRTALAWAVQRKALPLPVTVPYARLQLWDRPTVAPVLAAWRTKRTKAA